MKDFLKHNGILILIIALLLSLVIAVVSFLFGGAANPLSNLFGIVTTPVRNGVNAFVNWTEGIYSDAFQREENQAELEALRKENAALKEQAREGEADSRENDRFRNLLGLKEKHPDFQFEEATVTAHSASNWSSTLTISKGSADGVETGACVVDEYHDLVGIVGVTGLNWSTVMTVVDAELEMGGLVARTDAAAILEGDFELMGKGQLKLTYLPKDAQLLSGDEVTTSGLKSGGTATYPSGLLVGEVVEVRSDPSGMSDYAVLAPAADLANVEQVFVIKSFGAAE